MRCTESDFSSRLSFSLLAYENQSTPENISLAFFLFCGVLSARADMELGLDAVSGLMDHMLWYKNSNQPLRI